MTKATSDTTTFLTPVTTNYKGAYVPPGTEITLPADEAKRIIDNHGEYNGQKMDPGNTNARGVDMASISQLNEVAKINGGNGTEHKPIGEGEQVGEVVDLHKMTKTELIEYAKTNGVEIASSMNKDEIIQTIEDAGF